jgi:hypothetical protein
MSDIEWEANAATIRRIIGEFEHKYNPGFLEGMVDYRDLNADIAELQSLFKVIKLSYEDNEQLSAQASQVISAAREAKPNQTEKLKHDSSDKREGIDSVLDSAMAYAKSGYTPEDLDKARDLLDQSLRQMKDGWSGYNVQTEMMKLSDGCLTKADREALYAKYNDVEDTLRRRRLQISEHNYKAMMANAQAAVRFAEVAENLQTASDHLKMVGGEVKSYYFHKEHRIAIHAELTKGFDVLARRKGEIKRQQEQAIGRAKIARLTEAITRKEGKITALRSQIAHLKGKLAGHWSDDYIARTTTWIAEREAAIQRVESEISDIQENIGLIEAKLYR